MQTYGFCVQLAQPVGQAKQAERLFSAGANRPKGHELQNDPSR